jgi:plasmid rolling circle replication initiator protein Rep
MLFTPSEGDTTDTSVSPNPPCAVDTDAPYLSDLSKKDKPWDKHRKNSDKVADYYRNTEEFDQYATRIDFCSELLEFKMVPDDNSKGINLKLSSARFCRVRHCPVCQWRRSLMWKAKAYKILPRIVETYPKHRWLFLTLTVRNCQITELRDTLAWMNKAWQRLTQLKKFPAVGWIRSTEVTRGKDGSAHPHFHCLLMVKPGYFGKNYVRSSEWVEMWKGSLRVDYQVVLDIKAVRQGDQPMSLVPEILKYCVKESDLVSDRQWFLELTKQLHKMKAVVTGGVLKEYLRQLEEEPKDLIGKDETETSVDEGHLYFGWKKRKKKYQLIDNQ